MPVDVQQELILAGDALIGGGSGMVTAVDWQSGKIVWSGAVDGTAKGLAVAGGRLYVSTDKGQITCFGPAGTEKLGSVGPARDEVASPIAASDGHPVAAGQFRDLPDVSRGYCLVYGCETGELAIALARRTELLVYAVSPDAAKVAAVRKAVEAAGLLGSRVMVEQWPLDHVPYPDYFANLIVSETLLKGELPGSAVEMWRMLKPCGGVAYLAEGPGDERKPGATNEGRKRSVAWYRAIAANRPSWDGQTADEAVSRPVARHGKLDRPVWQPAKYGLRRRHACEGPTLGAVVRRAGAAQYGQPPCADRGAGLGQRPRLQPG